MSGLVQAMLVGMAMSVALACVAALLARSVRERVGANGVALWRTARVLAVLPIVLAPLVYAVPRTVDMPFELELLAPAASAEALPAAAGPGPLPAPVRRMPLAASLLAVLYLSGLALALIQAGCRHRARRRLLVRSRPASREERVMLESLARRLGVGAPEMRIGVAAVSPFLTGWRGVVVVPEDMIGRGEALRFALAHELCHLRRGDERDRLTGAALMTVLWFNWPLRRIERELDTAREMACDRDTLNALGEDALGGAQRRRYAEALIEVMRNTAPAASAFGSQDRRHREMRIKAIISPERAGKHRAVWLTATLLASALPFAGAQALVTERRVVVEPVEAVAPKLLPESGPVPTASPDPRPAPAVGVTADEIRVRNTLPGREARVFANGRVQVSAGMAESGFTHTVTGGRITSRYGDRPARPAGAPPFHGGYDIAASEGTAIHAPAGGAVQHADMGFQGSDRWGNTVLIDHGNGWQTLYAHMRDIAVEPGEIVEAGQQIGTVGSTGAATGPHVHVEVHRNGERVDPAEHIPGLR